MSRRERWRERGGEGREERGERGEWRVQQSRKKWVGVSVVVTWMV